MGLKDYFSQGKKEALVIEKISAHIELLVNACERFHACLEKGDACSMHEVLDQEREADTIRREVISAISDGAFLPYLRPSLCRFVELVDKVFDALEDTSNLFMNMELPQSIREECLRVAFLNIRISEMLGVCFETMIRGGNLREKTLAVRIYEKKIDDIKFELRSEIRKIPVQSYWEGRDLSEFIEKLTKISDIVEDASDDLHQISVSMY